MRKITNQEVLHIANLANIDLNASELDKFSREFNKILEYVSQINECDVSNLKEIKKSKDYKVVLKEDVVKRSLINRKDFLKNANKGRNKNGYIVTSRIIGDE